MDYFIDDILDASARRSKKSVPPAPEPPLPPSPTVIRRKKTNSVRFPEGGSGSAAGSSKLLEPPIAAAIPLPDTPAPSTDVPTAVEAEAPPKVVPEAGLGKSNYFPVAELAPPEEPHLRPGLFGSSHTGGSTYFSPMSELPPPVAEMSQAIEELPVADKHLTEPASTAEEQDLGGVPTTQEDTPREIDDDVPPMIHVAHQTVPTVHSQGAMLIGISGSPSSGKTTLAHLLSVILPPTIPSFTIHQDEFLIPDHLMIPPANGELATHRHTADLSAFKRFVEYSKDEGRPPPAFRSMQPVNRRERAVSRMPADVLDQLSSMVNGMPSLHGGRSIGIVEGDLLYHSETIRSLLDIKILLRASREDARARRFDRADDQGPGEGRKFWDTREYFDRTLWPHYSEEHAILFDRADVDGRPKSRICDNAGIRVQPMLDMSLEQALRWMVDVICRENEEVMYRHDREMASSIDRSEALEFCSCNEGFLGKIRQTIFDFL
ncbi:ribosylnicotinamide kinase [Xanthoria calcicola]